MRKGNYIFQPNYRDMRQCSSGKIGYSSQSAGLHALLETHRKTGFAPGKGPVNIYRCSICDQYHLTSQGIIHPELRQFLSGKQNPGSNDLQRWIDKFKDY